MELNDYLIRLLIIAFFIFSFFLVVKKTFFKDRPLMRYRELQQYIQSTSENIHNFREMAKLFGLEDEADRLLTVIKNESGEQGVTNEHINRMTWALFTANSAEEAKEKVNRIKFSGHKMTLKEEREYHRLAVKYLPLDRKGNKGQGNFCTVCDEFRNRAYKEIKTLELPEYSTNENKLL